MVNIRQLLLDILYRLGLIADYTVEYGAKTIGTVVWVYEKKKSGIAECWGRFKASGAGNDGTVAGWYYRLITYSLPITFKEPPIDAHADCKWGTGVAFASVRDVSNSAITVVHYGNQSAGDMTVWINVKGYWKELGGVIHNLINTLKVGWSYG